MAITADLSQHVREGVKTLAPDGRTLSVSDNPLGAFGAWGFALWMNGSKGSFRLHTGVTGSFESLEKHLGNLGRYTKREARWRGARIVSYETPKGGANLMWQGKHHELSTFVPGKNIPLEHLIDKLSGLDISDSRDGLIVRPRRGSGLRAGAMVGANAIKRVCGISVKPAESARQNLPESAGKRVPGGLLWRNDRRTESGKPLRTAVLANKTAVTEFAVSDPKKLARFVESAKIELR